MIYCTLKGGLGNQLFQFGAALRLAKGDSSRIKFVSPRVGSFTFRLSDLFGIEIPELFDYNEMLSCLGGGGVGYIIDGPGGAFFDQSQLDSDVSGFSAVILEGYFQTSKSITSLKRFLFERGGVQKVFSLSSNSIVSSFGIHYRMGDYQGADVQKEIGLVNPGYIDRCLMEFLRLGRHVDLFTDDPRILNIYKNNQFVNVICGGGDIDVFKKILAYEFFAIPNSTFSLMAAALSENIKMLVRPAQWTRNVLEDSLTDGLECKVVYKANGFIHYDNRLHGR